jgi:OFA family oxalate/formate antiporter-like MFS transporter
VIVKSIPSLRSAGAAAAQFAKAAQAGATRHLMGAGQMHAVMNVLTLSGIAFCALGLLGAWLLDNPTSGSQGEPGASAASPERSYTPGQMLATPQFYFLRAMLFLNVTAGILLISNALPPLQQLTGASPAAVAGAYGSVAMFNTLGRFFWGAISDRIGRTYAVALRGLLRHAAHGGNYGVLLTAWGAAGVAGPTFVAIVNDTSGAFSGALPVVAIVLAAATMLPLVTTKPAAATACS